MMHMEDTGLVIIDNLEAFAENLLNLIANESEKGAEQLIAIIQAAQCSYKDPIDSWITGWVYQYSRLRSTQVDKTIESLNSFPDTVKRLQQFKSLVQKGEWNKGSFNHYFFEELIQAIPGYKPLQSEISHEVILRLKELVISLTDQFITNYQLTQKLSKERENEFKQMTSSRQKTVEKIALLDNLKTIPQTLKGTSWFCLNQLSSHWKLQWLDPTGKAHLLQPTSTLINILTKNKLKNINNLKTNISLEIQNECIKARNNLLEKTRVFINPKELLDPKNPTDLILNLSSSYALLGDKTAYSLLWINRWGKKEAIPLEKYPELTEWLKNQKTIDEHQLKTYLVAVQTNKSIEMSDFKKKLSVCLTGIKEEQEPVIKTKEIPIGKLNKGLFKAVEDCLSQKHVRHTIVDNDENTSVTKPLKTPGKLNLNYFAITQLFDEPEPMEQLITPKI